jgi:hypothetical protein
VKNPVQPDPRPPSMPRAASDAVTAALADPRAVTILSTEHWSLLTSRSLSYNEAFSRAQMFLTFLSASLVALGFVATNAAVRPELPVVGASLLALDLFIGLATLGRLQRAASEEFLALQGMARIRHAYLELVPTLEPYFSTSRYDDLMGVMAAYGATPSRPTAAQSVGHGLTTMPGMVSVIDSAIAGALAAAIVLAIGMDPGGAFIAGVLTGLASVVALTVWQQRSFHAANRRLEVRFPSPTALHGAHEVRQATADQPPGRRNT